MDIMNINYFTQIMKGYLLLAIRRTGVNVDSDTHAEIDGAMDNLTGVINTLVADNQRLTARIEALEAAIIEAVEDDAGEISGSQFAAAQARWGEKRTQMNHSLSIDEITDRRIIISANDIQITITLDPAGRTVIIRADSTDRTQNIRSRGTTDIRNQVEYTLQEAPATQD